MKIIILNKPKKNIKKQANKKKSRDKGTQKMIESK